MYGYGGFAKFYMGVRIPICKFPDPGHPWQPRSRKLSDCSATRSRKSNTCSEWHPGKAGGPVTRSKPFFCRNFLIHFGRLMFLVTLFFLFKSLHLTTFWVKRDLGSEKGIWKGWVCSKISVTYSKSLIEELMINQEYIERGILNFALAGQICA